VAVQHLEVRSESRIEVQSIRRISTDFIAIERRIALSKAAPLREGASAEPRLIPKPLNRDMTSAGSSISADCPAIVASWRPQKVSRKPRNIRGRPLASWLAECILIGLKRQGATQPPHHEAGQAQGINKLATSLGTAGRRASGGPAARGNYLLAVQADFMRLAPCFPFCSSGAL
jgi:hypothetical protein